MTTFAEQQVTRLESLMAENVGVDTVAINGRSVRYTDLLKQYDYFKAQVAREQGTRPIAAQINLSNF